MGKLRGGPGGQDTTRIVGPMILATKKSQNVSEKEENFAIVVQRVSRVGNTPLGQKSFRCNDFRPERRLAMYVR